MLTPTNDVKVGEPLAYAPNFQGNLRVRYEWEIGDGMIAHVMPQVVYSASKYTDIITINRLKLDVLHDLRHDCRHRQGPLVA